MPSERRTARAIAPAQALERLRKPLALIAKRLAPGDAHLREDLEQEMALAILEHAKPDTPSRFLTLAAWRARNYAKASRFTGELLMPEHRVRRISEGRQRGNE